MTTTIKFLGASGTVTGSKYLVRSNGKNILVDAGVFQGGREWTERNWLHFSSYAGIEPAEIDAVLLTHAHIDHVALLPKLKVDGLNCPVFTTDPSIHLAQLLLEDFGKIQEEEAEYRANKGYSRFSPPRPLYTRADAIDTMKLFRSVRCSEMTRILPGITATWRRMGHILGACSITLSLPDKTITFSGDIGRYTVPILKDPEPVPLGDLLLIESTYGDRLHSTEKAPDLLAKVINRTAARDGMVLIPSFAVGRTQLLLYYLRELKERRLIPDIPVIVDSPMARDATSIYVDHPADYDSEALRIVQSGGQPFLPSKLRFIQSREESKALNSIQQPMVLISASGMLNGGRVLHHLAQRVGSPLNTLLFVGYQAQGTKGAYLKSGVKSIRVFKQDVAVRAEIADISGLSAHGDRDELIRWCRESQSLSKHSPSRVMVVHGEPEAATSFSRTLQSEMKWDARVAGYLDEIQL